MSSHLPSRSLTTLFVLLLVACTELLGLSGTYESGSPQSPVESLEFLTRDSAAIHLRNGEVRNAAYSVSNGEVVVTGERGGIMKLKMEDSNTLVSLLGPNITFTKRPE